MTLLDVAAFFFDWGVKALAFAFLAACLLGGRDRV